MKVLNISIIYTNPMPILRSRQSCFPYLCEMENGDILASHTIGEAFESVDLTTYISKSVDGGKTFGAPVQMFDKKGEFPIKSDCAKIASDKKGKIVALGYQFIRENVNLPVGNPETGGLLDDEVFYSVSNDGGQTWSKREIINCYWGPHVEASAPICFLSDGSWASPITGFNDWECTSNFPCEGRLLRSYDEGKTWNDDVVCMRFEDTSISCFEQRICQIDNGNIIIIGWNESLKTGELLNNHYTISTDNGKSFSKPIDTGVKGQASSVMNLGNNKILAIHAIRRDYDRPGIYGYVVDLSNGEWNIIDSALLWEPATPVIKNKSVADIFAYLKFGQPSAIKLKNGKVFMTFWAMENGQYNTYCLEIEL
ncbi:MAG: exo-alpha-sialidase [Clostridia bacterium]|nr:exo-alpha-sialidase [Clostridia bacterium]